MNFDFRKEEWKQFRNVNTLVQKAGVPIQQLRKLILKELMDNALDHGDSCQIGITNSGWYFVEDNGPGLGNPVRVANMFSFNRPFISTKMIRLPTRGALGNGLRVITGALVSSNGSLRVITNGNDIRLTPNYDTGNTAIASVKPSKRAIGTRIELKLGESIPTDDDALIWAQQALDLSQGGSAYKGNTSIHFYTLEAFRDLCDCFTGTVRDLVCQFDGFSDAKSNLVDNRCRGQPTSSLTVQEVKTLFTYMRKNSALVSPDRLGQVGSRNAVGYYKKKGNLILPTSGQTDDVITLPYVIETWGNKSSDQDRRTSFVVFLNRTPAVGVLSLSRVFRDQSLAELRGYGLECPVRIGRDSINLQCNIQIPYFQKTTDGKEPDLSSLQDVIKECLEKTARRTQRGKTLSKSHKQNGLIELVLPDAINHVSNGGRHRYSLRQLYYVVRPHSLDQLQKELDYGYFSKVIGSIEAASGDIDLAGLYRDSRGSIYHPHLHETIPLGTQSVENYQRPPLVFNKILYCEKEGFFPLLIDAKFPERHDCALVTSKGYASRAVKDVLDLLGDTEEEIQFFCIHDADGPGTKIFEALQQATAARPKRRVTIINLGLDPEEAIAMGLQVEAVHSQRQVPVAGYISAEHRRWLQTKRVELNAMPTDQFLGWLENKFDIHAQKKVIPSETILLDQTKTFVKDEIQQTLSERILEQAGCSDQVSEAFARIIPLINDRRSSIKELIASNLLQNPALHWKQPVSELASEIVGGAMS